MSVHRVRSEGGFQSKSWPGSEYRQWNSGGTLITEQLGLYPFNYLDSGTYAVMYDVVTDDFAKRVARGEIINNPMSRTVERALVATSSPLYKARLNSSGTVSEQRWPDYPKRLQGHAPLPDLSGLEAEAITKAWAGVNPPDWAGGVSLGEGKDTVRMLAGPLKGLAAIARKVLSGQVNQFVRVRTKQANGRYVMKRPRPGQPINLRTIAGGAASVWLTYRLGVTPLLAEVDDVLNRLYQDEFWERQTSRASVSRTDEAEVSSTAQTFTAGGHYVTWKGTIRSRRQATTRAGILYLPERNAAHKAGFGVQDIVPTAWALVPYSFVVDRFLLVEDFINGLQNYLTCRTLASWVSTKSITYSWFLWDQCTATPVSGYTGLIAQPPTGMPTYVTEQSYRSVGTAPSLTLKYSDKKLSLQVKHTLDHLALIIAPFIGRR